MENENTFVDENNFNEEKYWKEAEKAHKRGKVIGGIFIVIAGSLFLGRELGAAIPEWIFSWKMLLIAIGLISGFKHNFRRAFWLVPVAIGSIYLLCDFYPALAIKHLLWPVIVIFLGLVMIFRPKKNFRYRMHRRRYRRHYRYQHRNYGHHYQPHMTEETVNEDRIDTSTFMGAVKKTIISKNFQGGEVSNVLGGTELNLTQADFEGSITLDVTNVLGGTTLIVPANWEIVSELTSVLGSIDDKRPMSTIPVNERTKKLILKGTVFMGGIEIKSYSNN
jgi:predicted membrane protein